MCMHTLIQYIRNNAMFVLLLLSFLCFALFFGSYMFISKEEEAITPEPKPPIQNEGGAKITTLEANFTQDETVHLSWSIDKANLELVSVQLYCEGRRLEGEMKDLSSYALPQSIYQFPSGNCIFTLKVMFGDGTELSKDVTVSINSVTNIQMTKEQKGEDLLLKLSYSYDPNHPIGVPRIKLMMDNNYPFELHHESTTRTKNGNLENGVTTYRIATKKVADGTYHIRVRWIFDGVNISKDFDVTLTK